eukprot:g2945.t1
MLTSITKARDFEMRTPLLGAVGRWRPTLQRVAHKDSWKTAWVDFCCLDPKATLHGSRNVGIGCADSDVDVDSSLTFEEIMTHLVRFSKVPRLRLCHRPTGLEVDVTRGNFHPARDQVTMVLLQAYPVARDLVVQIAEWVHAHAEEMPVKEGFPNTHTFRIIAFHYLMIRPGGPLLLGAQTTRRADLALRCISQGRRWHIVAPA